MKKVYEFHTRAVERHVAELLATGHTTCPSPFLRILLEDTLCKRDVTWHKSVAGYGSCRYLHNWHGSDRRALGWDVHRIARWIRTGKLVKEDTLEALAEYDHISREELTEMFDTQDTVRREELILQLLSDIDTHPEQYRSWAVNRLCVRKVIYEYTL